MAPESSFSHINAEGRARMVDVTQKPITARVAVARSSVKMTPETLTAIKEGAVAKGDVLAVAQIAGIMAAKQTGQWIPMCHPLPLTGADLHFRLDEHLSQVDIEARISVNGPTGVEMEAMTAASAAALTIYDMAKSLDKTMTIGPTYLVHKEGGKSGTFQHFRAQVIGFAAGEGPSSASTSATGTGRLSGTQTLQLLPEGADAQPDTPAVWLNQPDLIQLTPGACLTAGSLRLEVTYARECGWLADVEQPGTLRVGDWLVAVLA